MQINIVDGLRTIEGTNTQVRYLPVITQMVIRIGKNTVSQHTLKEWMIEWSLKEERISPYYRNHAGKLTESRKKQAEITTAFENYLVFGEKIGFLTRISESIRCTKYGQLFASLIIRTSNKQDQDKTELLFYLYFIFIKDFDNIFTILEIIKYRYEQLNQVEESIIRRLFPDFYLQRLNSKMEIASDVAIIKIVDNFIKAKSNADKKSPSANKHLVPPRLEWLNDLHIIIKQNKSYRFTEKGKQFFQKFPKIDGSNLIDINDKWNHENLLSAIAFLVIEKEITSFNIVPKILQMEMVSKLILEFYDSLEEEGALRVSYLPAYLFISINLLIKHKILVEFSNLDDLLIESIQFDRYNFLLRKTQRVNESYISIRLL